MRISWFTLATLREQSLAGPVLSFEHDYGTPLMGVVWSGSGAELALSILNKTEPIDIKQVAAIVFR